MASRDATPGLLAALLAAVLLSLPASAQTNPLSQFSAPIDDYGAAGVADAQSFASSVNGDPNVALRFPNHGNINALVVFVQNQNDTSPDDCFDSTRRIPGAFYFYYQPDANGNTICTGVPDTPTAQSTTDDPVTEWPVNRSRGTDRLLPSWGNEMLAAPGTAPANFPAGSLSEYYRLNSGGRFTMTGYTYPKVYIPSQSPSWYRSNPGTFPNGGVRLSHEIITHVNQNPMGIVFDSRFDQYTNGTNILVPDGRFDMIILVFRNNTNNDYGLGTGGNAITSLGSTVYSSTYNGFSSSPLALGGLQVVDNFYSGSGVWAVGANRLLAHSTIAHEIGHRQFGLDHSVDSPNSIMNGSGNHPPMFTATDRLLMRWTTEEVVDYSTLSTSTRTIPGTFASDRVLRVKNGPSTGDLIIEARTHTDAWSMPAGPNNPYQDGDILDNYFVHEGLLVYKQADTYWGNFAQFISNSGENYRGFSGEGFFGDVQPTFDAGDSYTPLTRARFPVVRDPALDTGFGLTDIVRSGSGFTVKLWRDFLTAPGSKDLGTNYTLGNYSAGTFTSSGPVSDPQRNDCAGTGGASVSGSALGVAYPGDCNIARTDDFTFGSTVLLSGTTDSFGRALGLRDVLLGTPTVTLQANALLEVPRAADAVLSGPTGYTLPVSAGTNARVLVTGTMLADEVAFAPTNAQSGWLGIRYGVLTSRDVPHTRISTLRKSSVTGVLQYDLLDDGGPYPAFGAVEVHNRLLNMENESNVSFNLGTNGIMAVGPNTRVTVNGLSRVDNNQGAGLYVTAGAQLAMSGSARALSNMVGGIYLNGYSTRADLTGAAKVDDNLGVGLVAANQAHSRLRSAANTTTTSVSNNRGGPTALASASVDAGQCTPTGSGWPNNFTNNILGGNYDARAEDGSTVAARYAYWGGRTALTLVKDKSSTIDVFPVAPSATAADPGCPSISEVRSASQTAQSEAMANDDAPSASRGGPLTDAVVALASEARGLAWAGDPDGAFALLQEAALASVTDDDREAVYGAIGALAAEADTALTVPALVSSLEATAAAIGQNRPWARRALAVAYAVTGQTAQADGLAGDLAATEVGTAHAVFGHSVLIRLGVETAGEDVVLARLSAFAETVVPGDTLAAEAFASSLALVAATFPDADLSGIGGGLARGAGTVPGEGLSRGIEAKGAYEDEATAYPNPMPGQGTVHVSVSAQSAASNVSVYDALGRRVAVLHDGPLAAGPHEMPFAAAGLAPGVYVVVVRASPEGGAAWTQALRVTVAR